MAAGARDYIARSWSAEDGLPHNYILALAQARDGYLWIGTRSGLARFDGLRFVPMNSGALKGEGIGALCEGRDGSLWVALEGHGLAHLSRDGLFRYGPSNGLPNNVVRSICEGRDGSVWIATRAGLTGYRDGQFKSLTRQDGLAGLLVEVVCEDAAGNLWVGTSEGLNCLRAGKIVSTLTKAQGLPGNSITALCADRQGDLWIGTSEGLAVRRGETVRTPYHEGNGLRERFIRTLYEDRQGNLWIGTYGGLYRAARDELKAVATGDGGMCVAQPNAEGADYDRVMAIVEDQEGSIWVGSRDGLSRLRVRPFTGLGKQQGLSQNSVSAVCEDASDTLWIAAWRGGLNRFSGGQLQGYSAADGLTSDLLLSLCPGHDGSVWIGADHAGGLYRYKDGAFAHLDARQGLTNVAIHVICEDRQTNLWLGTTKTLTRYAAGSFVDYTPRDGLAGEMVRAILEDHAGSLWVGTAGGLSCFKLGKFTTFSTSNGLSHNTVTSLYEDAQTNLWVGTAGGLNRVREGRISVYTTRQGLFSDEVLEILEDNAGCLWLSSPNGVFRVEKKCLDEFDAGRAAAISCATFGKDEGMVGVQCTAAGKPAGWKGKDGRLWFTTIKGLAVTEPNIRSNERPPPVVIEQVLADKRPITSETTQRSENEQMALLPPSFLAESRLPLRIPPGRGELEVHYTALSFQAPEKNRFKYKLEGADSEWVDAGSRRVAYYNRVPPGHYRFRVIACNNDGVWNETGASLAVVLVPHVWQTWWFLCLAALAAVGSVGGTAAYLTRIASRRRLARLQQQHALEKERTRIARDIHDDLGSSLTHISMLSELAEADQANPKEVETHVRKIAASARETVRSLDEIVWAVSPENDTWNSLAEYLSEFANEFFGGTGIRCRLEMPMDMPPGPLPSEVRHSLFLTLKEALNNALKHGHPSEVRISMSHSRAMVEITIADDGQGFALEPGDSGAGGNGLRNMRERIENLHGEFRLETAPGKGTCIRLRVPVDTQAQIPSHA